MRSFQKIKTKNALMSILKLGMQPLCGMLMYYDLKALIINE